MGNVIVYRTRRELVFWWIVQHLRRVICWTGAHDPAPFARLGDEPDSCLWCGIPRIGVRYIVDPQRRV